MSDVNANIGVNIDTSAALAQLKDLQRQISQFHSSIAKSSEAAALAQRDLQRNFLNSVNSIGSFSAELRTVKTTSESFTTSLEKNKFSMREYFRYAGAATKTFGTLFKSEYDTIGKVAEDRVKKLQTQYIKMGRDASGAMKAIAVIPNQLDMGNLATQTQIAAQKQALFNQLLKQGSTNLLNFGKNTQWAGRQLMVGFTLPLMAVGSAAAKTFMQMEAQAIKFKKVYGDIFTPQAEAKQALSDIQALGKEFTKYGIAVSTTVGLAADAAAAGFKGVDLQRQTTEATRLSILGQIDSQKALQTTITLQNAFGTSSADLANNIDFLNAVENQTVLTLDDITTAIPKVAPVIQQLGGNVKDLAFFLTAMKQGGVNASEGANALKSGLASLINPSTKAREMLKGLGIDIVGIVQNDKGDLKKTVIDFAQALDTLAPLQRAQAIEQMFGKFQFARLSTLFQNVTKDGTQAAKVLELAGASVQDLASLSNKELGITADSAMNKFKKSVEDLKVAIVPVGEAFLKTVTPILDFVSKIADKFSHLSDGTKKAITVMVTVIGGLGPILLMTFGLLANGVANIIKLFLTLRTGYQKLTGQSKNLGEQTQYMTTEQIDAAAAAHSLNQAHATLTQQFTVEAEALQRLIAVYQEATSAAARFAAINPGMMVPPTIRQKLANSGIVHGPGGPKDDKVHIMASNGEAVISAATVNANKPLIDELMKTGTHVPKVDVTGAPGSADRSSYSVQGTQNLIAGKPGIPQLSAEEIAARNARVSAQIEARKAARLASIAPVAAPVVSRGKQVNVPGTYHSGHFGGSSQMTGEELIAYSKTISQAAEKNITEMVARTQDGLKRLFTVFDNRIVAVSDELNLAVGKSGSGQTAPIKLARRDLVTRGNVAHPELVDQLKQAGVPIEEIKTTVNKLTAEIDKGFNDLGEVTTVTAVDIDKIIQKAYTEVAKTDNNVKAAYAKMQKVTAVADVEARGGKQNRISLGKSYKDKRSAYGTGMQEIAGNNVPYSPVGAFQINDAMAAEAGKTKQVLANIYKQLGDEVKIKLSLLKDDVQLFTKTLLEEAKLAGVAGFEVGDQAIKGIAKGTGSASDSKKAIIQGKNVISGFVHALQGGQDNAIIAGEQLGNAGITGLQNGTQSGRRIATRGQGAPTSLPMSIITASLINSNNAQEKNTKQLVESSSKLSKMNSALQGGSFALMSLSGMGQMFGGTLGDLSNKIFAVSGALFALQTVTQLLTQSQLLNLVASRANTVAQAMGAVNFKALFIGVETLGARLLTAGKFGLNFLGIWGKVAAVVITVGAGLFAYSKAQQAAKEKVNAFSNALVTTTEQLKSLGDYFGISPTISALEKKTGFAPGTAAQIGAVDQFRQSDSFKTYGFPTVKALKNLNNTQATQVLNAKVFELLGAGFSKDQIKIIIQAIQQEAKRTNLKIDFANISLDKLPQDILKDFDKQAKKFKTGAWIQAVLGTQQSRDKAMVPFKSEAGIINKYLNGISSALQTGQVNGTQFNAMFDSLVTSLQKMPDQSNAIVLLDTALKAMSPDVAKAAIGVKDFKDKLLLLRAASVGLGDQISKEMIKALSYSGTDILLNDIKGRTEAEITAMIDKQTKDLAASTKAAADAAAKAAGGASGGTDVLSKTSKLAIANMQKELDLLKTKKDSLSAVNDELKRQYDYQQKLQQLNQDALQAKISGNYIQAANLQQQKAYTTSQFNTETASISLDKRITNLENQISAIQATNRVTAAQKALSDSLAKSVGTTVKKASGGLITGTGTGTSDSIPAYLSNGEYVVKASAVQQYGKKFFDNLNAQKFATGGEVTGGKKKNWFQRYADSLTKTDQELPSWIKWGKDPLGSTALIRKLAGTDKNGSWLAASLFGLNFTGMGAGKGAVGKAFSPVVRNLMDVPGIAVNDSAKLTAVEKALMRLGDPPLPKPPIKSPSFLTNPSGFRSTIGNRSVSNLINLTPEMKSFHMADIDAKAINSLSKMDLNSIKIPKTGISFNPEAAKMGLEGLKNGRNPAGVWEIVQAQRESLLRSKYPKVDLSNTAKFNEYYAKEFYGINPDEAIKLFKGVRSTSGSSWRTGKDSLETYFSTNPHIAATYSWLIGSKEIGKELPMFSINKKINELTNFLGEGAIRNSNAQGSMEFPQLLSGSSLSQNLPTEYSLPGHVYGQMFGPTAKELKIQNQWPKGFTNDAVDITPDMLSTPSLLNSLASGSKFESTISKSFNVLSSLQDINPMISSKFNPRLLEGKNGTRVWAKRATEEVAQREKTASELLNAIGVKSPKMFVGALGQQGSKGVPELNIISQDLRRSGFEDLSNGSPASTILGMMKQSKKYSKEIGKALLGAQFIGHTDLHGGNMLVNQKTKELALIDFEGTLGNTAGAYNANVGNPLFASTDSAKNWMNNIPAENLSSYVSGVDETANGISKLFMNKKAFLSLAKRSGYSMSESLVLFDKLFNNAKSLNPALESIGSKTRFAKGGLIKGKGTGTSDSISAGLNGNLLPQLQVSNNEYLMKASTVAKYGTGFMDAINAQQLSPTTPVAQSATGNVVYNNYVTVNGTDLNKKEVADEVIYRLNKSQNQNNKSNKVNY